MNDPMERGFALFAQNIGSRFGGSKAAARMNPSLYDGARPNWDRLPLHEKMLWEARACEIEEHRPKTVPQASTSPQKQKRPKYEHTGFYCSSRRNRRLQQRKEDFRPVCGEEEDDEDEIGVPMVEIEASEHERELDEKYARDRQMVTHQIMEKTGGCLDKIKNLRFLLASVQTFGNVDNACMMAEYSMNEFNLKDGVIDRLSSMVGPWEVENEIQRHRAVFHSNETHRIPLHLNTSTYDKRQLLMEILGRSEPAIAGQQGLRVGLYTDETEDAEDRMNRLYVGDQNPLHIVDANGRRWIVCLRQEYYYMMASSEHLRNTVGLDYDGFPCTGDRFVLADAFVDAVADCIGAGRPVEMCAGWLGSLGNHLPEEFSTPWERSGELFCGRHRHERNSCCATVTASRATFIILYSLEDLLREY